MLTPMSETTPLAAPGPETSRFIVNDAGERVGVILSVEAYEQLLDALEELEDIRAYDEAKASDDEVVPFEQAMQEIEQGRR